MSQFVETNQLNQMISYKPYVETKYEKRKVKYELLDHIKEVIGDKWYRFKEGTRQAFDMICFFSTERGFFYAGDDYLAERHNISDRTIRNRFRELEELGQVVKVYRRSSKCNGRGKPIYLFVNHPYFTYWVNLLELQLSDFHTDFHTENAEPPCESKEGGAKKVPTYYLPTKHEKDNNISINKVIQYVVHRVNDSIRQGTKIDYLSSYVNRVVRSLENQALYAENARQQAKRKALQEENSRIAMELLGVKATEPIFYNWLEK